MIFETPYASSRQLVAWVLSWRQNATVLAPTELAEEAAERIDVLRDRHSGGFEAAATVSRPAAEAATTSRPSRSNGHAESPIRPSGSRASSPWRAC